MTSCSESSFTCSDGSCVSLDERCDGKLDCKDMSDEEDCKILITFKGYNKMLVPPPSGNETKFSYNVSVFINKIMEIDENDGYFKTKFTYVRRWVNSQLIYEDLKRNPTKNLISSEDKERMWRPWTVFENIKQKTDINPTDAPKIMMIIPNQAFYFEMDDKTNFRNTRLFKGDENIIHYQKEQVVNWVCDFDLRWYPFDLQKCTMEMYSSTSTVMIIPSSVKYLGPKELTRHIVKDVTISSATINSMPGIIVEVILGRPLFGTTLSVFMPTTVLLVLSQMVRVFGQDHLEMVIEVNLTLLLVLATL